MTDAMTKTITVRDFVDAIEKNGVRHITGQMWDQYEYYNPETGEYESFVRGGCAMAQGILNLGVSDEFFNIMAASIGPKVHDYAAANEEIFGEDHEGFTSIPDRIVHLNDSKRLSLTEIADHLRKEYAPFMDTAIADVPVREWKLYTPEVEAKIAEKRAAQLVGASV